MKQFLKSKKKKEKAKNKKGGRAILMQNYANGSRIG